MIKVPNNITLIDETNDMKLDVDESKAVRVIINLLRNSIDAMPKGGTIHISNYQTNGHVSIIFADTGVGISPETMPKIFTPLFTTKAQGMGFGLPISKRIVEAHGGEISITSEIGKGTTCVVTFPEDADLIGSCKSNWLIDYDLK
jgi:signal transduction histidine kinase